MKRAFFLCALLFTFGPSAHLRGADAARLPPSAPLPQAHAHNDYEHPRPLLDALDQGFCSVEADIYLVDGALLVAHDRDKVSRDRTLEALYLDPLRQRVMANGGQVHRGGTSEFTLLVDIKSAGAATYRKLREVLEAYRGMLTSYETNRVRTNAVTVILSGDRPWDMVAAESPRWVGLDGRMSDLDRNPPASLVPLVSDNWRTHFAWNGEGSFPDDQKARLNQLVQRAHAQGRRIRFWGALDAAVVWQVQREEGVDVINTDQLAGLARYLRR